MIRRFLSFTTACLVVLLISGASSVAPAETKENLPVVETQEAAVEDIVVAVAVVEAEPVQEEKSPLPVRQPYAGNSDNPFSGHSWYVPPPARETRRSAASTGPRTPTAPPLPYELLGTYQQQGSSTLYFLVQGDRVFDVVVGDTLDDTYRIDGEKNGQLMFTYLPLNTSQGLRLGDQR